MTLFLLRGGSVSPVLESGLYDCSTKTVSRPRPRTGSFLFLPLRMLPLDPGLQARKDLPSLPRLRDQRQRHLWVFLPTAPQVPADSQQRLSEGSEQASELPAPACEPQGCCHPEHALAFGFSFGKTRIVVSNCRIWARIK